MEEVFQVGNGVLPTKILCYRCAKADHLRADDKGEQEVAGSHGISAFPMRLCKSLAFPLSSTTDSWNPHKERVSKTSTKISSC